MHKGFKGFIKRKKGSFIHFLMPHLIVGLTIGLITVLNGGCAQKDRFAIKDSEPTLRLDTTESIQTKHQYLESLLKIIKQHWKKPYFCRRGLNCNIELVINYNGIIDEIRYEKRSNNRKFDKAAYHAIMDSLPFPPIPPETGLSQIPLRIVFDARELCK